MIESEILDTIPYNAMPQIIKILQQKKISVFQ